jgi:hypothetical protein
MADLGSIYPGRRKQLSTRQYRHLLTGSEDQRQPRFLQNSNSEQNVEI